MLSLFEPNPQFGDLERAMDRMIERSLGRWPAAASAQLGHPTFKTIATTGHAFDIIEKDSGYDLIADAPGFKPDDIKVELQDKTLVVCGKQKQEVEQHEGKVWHSERRSYQFSRSFTLPDNAKAEDISAHLENGILTVNIPKVPEAEKPEAKRINIQVYMDGRTKAQLCLSHDHKETFLDQALMLLKRS